MFVTKIEVVGDTGVKYEITTPAPGVLHCTCPAWKFSKEPVETRRCKHIKFVAKSTS